MNEKRKGARRWTALALSVAMVFGGIGILPAPVKAEAADVAAAVNLGTLSMYSTASV